MKNFSYSIYSNKSYILSFLFVIYIFFVTIVFLDLIKPPYTPTLNRVTLIFPLDIVLINNLVDQLVVFGISIVIGSFVLKNKFLQISVIVFAISSSITAYFVNDIEISFALFLLSFALVAFTLFLQTQKFIQTQSYINLRYVAYAIIIFGLIFEAVSLSRWVMHPIFPDTMFNDLSWRITEIETKLFYVSGIFSPFLLILIVLSFLIRPIFSTFTESNNKLRKLNLTKKFDITKINNLSGNTTLFILISAIVMSFLLPLYPYIPTLNPTFHSISVDVLFYEPWMETVLSGTTFSEVLQHAFVTISGGDRPLFLLFVYFIIAITGSSTATVLQLFPILLSPLLTFSVYYFIKTGTEKKSLASVVALIVPVSTTMITGMYAGFYANWLALVLVFFTLAFLLQYFKNQNKKYLFCIFFGVIAVLFSHNYTWAYLISTLLLFLILSAILFRKNRNFLKLIIFLGIVIASTLLIDYSKAVFLTNDSAIDKEVFAITEQVSWDYFSLRWENLQYVFTIYLGGFFTNTVFYIIAIIWSLNVNYKDNFNRIILSIIHIGALGMVAGVFSVQARILWDIPIFIPVGIVLYSLIANSKNNLINKILFVTIMLLFLNYVFRSMSNFIPIL